MELADILSELWRRRAWLVVGLVVAAFAAAASTYRIDFGLPPTLTSKDFEVGTASVDVLIDAPQSPLPDTGKKFEALQLRAGIYAQLIRTAPIRDQIARKLGIPPEAITAEGPTPVKAGNAPSGDAAGPQRGQRTDASPRANQLVNEGKVYRIFTRPQSSIPMISIQTQAADAETAARLADASVVSLQEYIGRRQREQKVPRDRQVTIQKLDKPAAGVLTTSASLKTAVLVFLGVFFGACVLVILASSFAMSLRRARAVAHLRTGELDADLPPENAPTASDWPMADQPAGDERDPVGRHTD